MDLLLPFCLVYDTRDLKIRGREDLGRLPEVNLTFDKCARVPTAQLIPVLLSQRTPFMPFCRPVENVSILLFILIHKIPERPFF